jgi:hypothetical protein
LYYPPNLFLFFPEDLVGIVLAIAKQVPPVVLVEGEVKIKTPRITTRGNLKNEK